MLEDNKAEGGSPMESTGTSNTASNCTNATSGAFNPTSTFMLPLDSPVWTQILSYLAMQDLVEFGESHSSLLNIVISFLRNGNPLVINFDTMLELPIEENEDLYFEYGFMTVNLVVDGIKLDLNKHMDYFPNVQELTLKNTFVTTEKYEDEGRGRLRSFRKLNLIRNSFQNAYSLDTWIKSMLSLECMHMAGNKVMSNPPEPLQITRNGHPTLHSLTLDACSPTIIINLRSFQGLQSLRFLCSVDGQQMQQIQKLNVKTVEVRHCFQVPMEENLILSLNDDCLLHLQRFLHFKDWMEFQETHPRLQHLRIAKYKIDYRSLDELPLSTNRPYYERMGGLVSHLVMVNHGVDITTMLPSFTNLTGLTLYSIVDIKDLAEHFRRLNSTLTTLHVLTEIDGLLELTNLRELQIDSSAVTPNFIEFLELNVRTIRTLKMSVQTASMNDTAKRHTALFRVILQMENLRSLNITTSCAFPMPMVEGGCLPNLKRLVYCEDSKTLDDFLELLDGVQLSSFSYKGCAHEFEEVVCQKMKSLVKLSVTMTPGRSTIWLGWIPEIFKLSMLERLALDGIPGSLIWPLVKGLPKLTVLAILRKTRENGGIINLRENLKLSKRNLTLEDGHHHAVQIVNMYT